MKAYLVIGGVVSEVVEVASLDDMPNLIPHNGLSAIGWVYQNGKLINPNYTVIPVIEL